jgi:hypothetical protein
MVEARLLDFTRQYSSKPLRRSRTPIRIRGAELGLAVLIAKFRPDLLARLDPMHLVGALAALDVLWIRI